MEEGKAYNELHVEALTHVLEGEHKLIALHDVEIGFKEGNPPEFLQLLMKLMLTFIKHLAAVPATRSFKTMPYDSSKGLRHFYTQLL